MFSRLTLYKQKDVLWRSAPSECIFSCLSYEAPVMLSRSLQSNNYCVKGSEHFCLGGVISSIEHDLVNFWTSQDTEELLSFV